MRTSNNWRATLAGAVAACFLVACGGGGGGGAAVVTPPPPTVDEAKIATDGLNWINFRRRQLGVAELTTNTQIGTAAQAHSYYQKANNFVSHDETSGKTGFTGTALLDRLKTAGYLFNLNNNSAYGEVISATQSNSGAYMAEELVTAIYHRFVMFEPIFKEIGTGAATTAAGYSYFTADMAANNGYGVGLGSGKVVVWPFSGQTGVTPNFFSDNEQPDPVPNLNEVGYPISVHGDITAVLTVQTFTVRERGASADLAVRLLTHALDAETKDSTAAIIPLAPLKSATTYDVTFVGTADTVPLTKNWSFTTK